MPPIYPRCPNMPLHSIVSEQAGGLQPPQPRTWCTNQALHAALEGPGGGWGVCQLRERGDCCSSRLLSWNLPPALEDICSLSSSSRWPGKTFKPHAPEVTPYPRLPLHLCPLLPLVLPQAQCGSFPLRFQPLPTSVPLVPSYPDLCMKPPCSLRHLCVHLK